MHRLARLYRHLTISSRSGRALFPETVLQQIEDAIAGGETRHRAEIHMIIEPSLALSDVWNGIDARERARALFAEYRIWDTEENCGVLVYVNIADHQVEIVADRTVGRLIAAAEWQRVCDTMTRGFADGKYGDGVLRALDQLNALLEKHFPARGSGDNQLANRPLLL